MLTAMTRERPVTPVVLTKDLARSIRRGHPWIYDQAVGVVAGEPGDVVQIADERGAFAVAYLDPEGPIRARVLVRSAANSFGRTMSIGRARPSPSGELLIAEMDC